MAVLLMLGLYCTIWDRYMQVLYLGRAPRTKETLPDFCEKCLVARHSLVFRRLTGSQRTPGIWGVTECGKCVYVKNTEHGFVIICLYVDDILIMGINNEVIKTTKEMFHNKFDMKDLGVVDVILGIKISKTSDGLILSQSHYIEKILKKFKQNDSSPMRTPVDVNLHLSKNNGKSLSQKEYA